MSLSRSKIIVAAVAALLLLGMLIVILWPRPVEEPERPAHAASEVPMPFPDAWADQEPEEEVSLTLSESPQWSIGGTDTLIDGPTVDGMSMQWSEPTGDDWSAIFGEAHDDDVDLYSAIWLADGFPAAIMDFDVVIRGDSLSEPLTVTMTVPGHDAEVIDASLDYQNTSDGLAELDILAGRFATAGPTVQVHSPSGTTGHISESGEDLTIDWTLWSGIDIPAACLDDENRDAPATRRASIRLVVQFGDHPLVAPLPFSATTEALGTPIFVDAPTLREEHWADGRARHAQDFARRLRALAFGHSDRSDPRYGNGGLLASGMGALFVVPIQWWDDEEIQLLRDSLSDTEIEVISDGEAPTDDAQDIATQLVERDNCDALFPASADDIVPLTLLYNAERERPFTHPMVAPLPPIIEAGRSTTERDELLASLFEPRRGDSIFNSGEHRALFFPIVATRNPLEDISSESILSPDRGGQWTLHDSLTRRLSMREMTGAAERRLSTSLASLQAERARQIANLAIWAPDGSLDYQRDEPSELLFFGNTDQIEFDDAERVDGGLSAQVGPDDIVEYGGELRSVRIRVEE